MYLSASMPMGAACMATVKLEGMQEIEGMMRKLGDVPFEVVSKALDSMADVADKAVERTGRAMGVYDPRSDEHILDNISHTTPKQTASGGYSDVSFDGSRERGKNSIIVTRNNEIAFVNEYGKRGQEKRPFIRQATEQYAKQIFDPGEKIIGDWFQKTAEQ